MKNKLNKKKEVKGYWCKTCEEGISSTSRITLNDDFLKAHKGHKIEEI